MAQFKLKGRATINGAVGKSFEVIVSSDDSNFSSFSSRQAAAVQAIHPDWKSINVDYCTKL